MASLDEISLILGEIRSDIKHVRAWQDGHEEADQRRFQQLAERIDKHNGFSARVDQLELKMKDAIVITDRIEKFGWIGRGVLIGLSLVGGVFGAAVLQLAKWL